MDAAFSKRAREHKKNVIWFVWSIWFIWLFSFNQTNKTNQTNHITVSYAGWVRRHWEC